MAVCLGLVVNVRHARLRSRRRARGRILRRARLRIRPRPMREATGPRPPSRPRGPFFVLSGASGRFRNGVDDALSRHIPKLTKSKRPRNFRREAALLCLG